MTISGSIAAGQVAHQHRSAVVEGDAARKISKRDRVLDVMRGVAVVLMVLSHVAPSSVISTLAHLPVWISAADSFILISGIVLGLRFATRMSNGSALTAYKHIWRRAFELYVVHCVLMFAVVAIHETTGRLLVASVESVGGWFKAAILILVLRFQSNDFMNILPLFVLFLSLAPIGLEACRRGYTLIWLGASLLLWALAQRDPNIVPLLHPASGKIVFSIGAWQFIFCIGLAIGFHREALLKPFWHKHKRLCLWIVGVFTGALFVYAQLQRDILGFPFLLDERWHWVFSKQTWAPVRAAYTLGILFIMYLVVQRLMASNAPMGRVMSLGQHYALELNSKLELMGQRSLYCFVMHLLFALTASAFATTTWGFWYQELFAVISIIGLYELAKHGILAKFLPA